MSDQDPMIRLNLGEEVFEAKRDNAHLFTHIGRLAMYDHIFLVTSEDGENRMSGTFLFNNLQLPPETFTRLATFMLENGYHADFNRQEVSEADKDAYERNLELFSSDLGDEIPEDWL